MPRLYGAERDQMIKAGRYDPEKEEPDRIGRRQAAVEAENAQAHQQMLDAMDPESTERGLKAQRKRAQEAAASGEDVPGVAEARAVKAQIDEMRAELEARKEARRKRRNAVAAKHAAWAKELGQELKDLRAQSGLSVPEIATFAGGDSRPMFRPERLWEYERGHGIVYANDSADWQAKALIIRTVYRQAAQLFGPARAAIKAATPSRHAKAEAGSRASAK